MNIKSNTKDYLLFSSCERRRSVASQTAALVVEQHYIGIFIALYFLLFTDAGAISQRERMQFQRFGLEQGLPTLCIEDVVSDSRGFLWLATPIGLCRYDGFRSRIFRVDESIARNANNWFSSMKILGDTIFLTDPHTNNYFLFCTHDLKWMKVAAKSSVASMLRRRDEKRETEWSLVAPKTLRNSSGQTYSLPLEIADVGDIAVVEENEVWITDSRHLFVAHLDSKITDVYTHEVSNPKSIGYGSIRHVYKDGQGNVWICTYGGGISRVVKEAPRFVNIQTIPLSETQSGGFVFGLAEDKGGRIWSATQSAGLQAFDPNTGTRMLINSRTRPLSVPDNDTRAIIFDEEGRLWSGCSSLWCIDVRQKRKHEVPIPAFEIIRKTADGMMWLYGRMGDNLIRYDPKNKCVVDRFASESSVPTSLSSINIREVFQDSKKRIWVGTRNGLNLFEPNTKTFKRFLYNSRADGNILQEYHGRHYIQAIVEDKDGLLWLGTRGGGLLLFNPNTCAATAFSSESGVSDAFIYTIARDSFNNLWLGTSTGLMRFSIPDKRVVEIYTTDDGLLSNEFNTWSSVNLRDGRIAMGGLNGYHIFDPRDLIENKKPPPVTISKIEVNGAEFLPSVSSWNVSMLQLLYTQNTIGLEFSSPEYVRGTKVRYQYRMASNTDLWLETSSDRRILLSALPPGQHKLQVRASYNGTLWNEPFTFPIYIEPPVWQRWWFIGICAVFTVSVVVSVTRYVELLKYRANLERMERYKHIMQQRSQISLDMHDDVGATIMRILTISRMPLPNDRSIIEERMGKISSLSASVVDSVRQIVWSLNPANDSIYATVATLRSYTVETLRDSGIETTVTISADDEGLELPLSVRRNLYLFVKEAVNNIVRHAHATKAEFAVSAINSVLTVRISDNGCGYDQYTQEGNGIVNMKKRIHSIGGTLTIKSIKDEGVSITAVFRLDSDLTNYYAAL